MTSVKVKFQISAGSQAEGTIIYHVVCGATNAKIPTGYRLYACEWDSRRCAILSSENGERCVYLRTLRERVRLDSIRIADIVARFESVGLEFSARDVADEYMAVASECCLLRFMDSIICRLKSKGKQRTAETYRAACQSFRKFMCCSDLLRHNASSSGDDIMLDALTSEIVEAYEAYLRDRGVVPNTVSFYMRILRAAYNRAVEAGMVKQSYPFRHVYTGVDKTVKRALPLPLIRKIRTLDLSSDPALDYARDMFLLSFYLRGMSFVDMAFLRKSDLKSGCVTYRRRKTGQLLSVRWTHEMCSIVGKYQPNGTAYLLPILTKSNVNEHNAYRNRAYAINYGLKKIAGMVGADIPLTLYCARHSWASAARTKGIPVSVISEGMGHDSESTTQIYLASIDTSVVDRANALILRSI